MEFNSLRKPGFIIIITFIAILFILFNLNSTAEISFLFIKLGQIPLLVIVLLSFSIGCIFTFFLFYKGLKSSKKKKEEKEKKEKKEADSKEESDKK